MGLLMFMPDAAILKMILRVAALYVGIWVGFALHRAAFP